MDHLADRLCYGAFCRCASISAFWRRCSTLCRAGASDRGYRRIRHLAIRSRAQSPRATAVLAHGRGHQDFRATSFAATLFSRLFGMGCIILTGLLGSRLFGKNTGWFAALALVTCYTFVRGTTTLRMDSALTFGVLLAMLAYFRGEKSWGPPLFYGGVAVAVLAKS